MSGGDATRGADVVGPASDVELGDAAALQDTPSDPPDYGPMPDLGPPPTADAVFETFADFFSEDAPDTAMVTPDTPGLPDGATDPLKGCETLGIASEWSGAFNGNISYEMTLEIPGADQSGTLPVAGTLQFDIKCIEQKLVVSGQMVGTALDTYPFSLGMKGTYNPETGELAALIVDGEVTIIIVKVMFEGKMSGDLETPLLMEGVWSGNSTGTDPEGLGTATGLGQWWAAPE